MYPLTELLIAIGLDARLLFLRSGKNDLCFASAHELSKPESSRGSLFFSPSSLALLGGSIPSPESPNPYAKRTRIKRHLNFFAALKKLSARLLHVLRSMPDADALSVCEYELGEEKMHAFSRTIFQTFAGRSQTPALKKINIVVIMVES
jgi:hypothetical protein